MFLHLIVFGWAIFTAVFSFQLVQIFLYGQEKIALVDIRNIPVLLVLLGVPLIPITIHSFKKLTSAEKTYWSWFCLFGVYGIFVLALIFIRNLNTIAIYSSAIIDTSIILCLEKFVTAMKERSNGTPPPTTPSAFHLSARRFCVAVRFRCAVKPKKTHPRPVIPFNLFVMNKEKAEKCSRPFLVGSVIGCGWFISTVWWKIQPFSPVFPLADSMDEAFSRLSLWKFKK